MTDITLRVIPNELPPPLMYCINCNCGTIFTTDVRPRCTICNFEHHKLTPNPPPKIPENPHLKNGKNWKRFRRIAKPQNAEAFKRIYGIDISELVESMEELSNMNHDAPTYLECVQQFLDISADVADTMNRAIEKDKTNEIHK